MTDAGQHHQPAPPRLGPVLLDRETISRRVGELGEQLSREYEGRVPVLVTVLRGATIFLADLSRSMTVDHELDFIAVSAYGEGTAGMQARVLKDVQIPLGGRDVVLVEDIIDTGLTLRFVLRWLRMHDPRSLEVCSLLDRPHRRLVNERIRYRGFNVPDRFCVGYGFDYQQQFRNLPDLHELSIDEPLQLLRPATT